jgi:hypothetical protein
MRNIALKLAVILSLLGLGMASGHAGPHGCNRPHCGQR